MEIGVGRCRIYIGELDCKSSAVDGNGRLPFLLFIALIYSLSSFLIRKLQLLIIFVLT